MSHAFLLCMHVETVVIVRFHLYRHILLYGQSVSLKAYTLAGIVRQKPHAFHPEFMKNLCAYSVIAFISLMAQMQIGIHRIKAFFLELVCLYLIHQAYSATFLLKVEQYTAAFLFNHLHGAVKLLSAVAAARTEYVACGA